MVKNVGNDYIDLSVTDCEEGSDIPQVGDSLVQFGNRTNTDRMSLIYVVVNGDEAPAIIWYDKVNSYTLEGKKTAIISPKEVTFNTRMFNLLNDDGTTESISSINHRKYTGGGKTTDVWRSKPTERSKSAPTQPAKSRPLSIRNHCEVPQRCPLRQPLPIHITTRSHAGRMEWLQIPRNKSYGRTYLHAINVCANLWKRPAIHRNKA